MNRRNVTILIVIALAVALAATAAYFFRSRTGESSAEEASHEQTAEIYYCPMHPTVRSHEPGNCPICGMRLVRRTAEQESDAERQLASEGFARSEIAAIALSPQQRVTANVRTAAVEMMTGTGDVVTTGRVTFDERRMAQVTAYAGGRVERLYVNFTGDTVRRGQAVATIYSPELFSTQQEYLLALSNRDRMRSAGFDSARSAAGDLVESARRRLLLFGMSEGQIAELEKSRQPVYATTVHSPVAGVVTAKLVVPQQYVTTGQPLFQIADLSQVWVDADVYEQQLPEVRVGQRVEITSPAIPGGARQGVVAFIQPTLAGQTRTATVRIELPNPELALKPDMYVTVRLIGVETDEHVMVPSTAVIDRGQNQFVWVEISPNTFEPRKVTRGARHGDQVVIDSGLEPGEEVVVHGAFLLDSEAQLRAVTAGDAHPGH